MEPRIQRWSAKRKAEGLLPLIEAESTPMDADRDHGLNRSEVEAWIDTFTRLWRVRPLLGVMPIHHYTSRVRPQHRVASVDPLARIVIVNS